MGYCGAAHVGLVFALSISCCGASFPRCWFPASIVLAFSFDLDDEERAVDGCLWFMAALFGRGLGFFSSGSGVLFVLSGHAWRFTRMFRPQFGALPPLRTSLHSAHAHTQVHAVTGSVRACTFVCMARVQCNGARTVANAHTQGAARAHLRLPPTTAQKC